MIELRFAALRESKPHEYAIRFLFGGVCTALAGLIAKRFGPSIGGLFLAFPAIFPAAVSLIQSHEKERKAKAGFDGSNRGRSAASIDSAGAALGSIGLAGFALTLFRCLPRANALIVMLFATAIWLLIVFALWEFRKHHFFRRRKNRNGNKV